MNPFSLKDVQSVIKYISGEGIEVEHKKRNYKLQKKTKGGHSLHKDSFWLQTMTAFNQKLLRGVVRKAQGAGRKANNTIDAVRKTPCAMRFPPWPPEAIMEVNMIFYFHGFASSEKSWKIDLLKKRLTAETIIVPTLPVDPAGVVKLFEQVVTENGKPGLVIGSSLGGFYAYYAATRFDIPAVLINPSITPWVTLKDHIGIHKRYYTGEPFEFKAQYLEALKKINDEINNYDSKHHRLHFFLSADDEVLDLSGIPTKFTAAGSIRFYDNSGHSFNRFAEIIPEIEKLLE